MAVFSCIYRELVGAEEQDLSPPRGLKADDLDGAIGEAQDQAPANATSAAILRDGIKVISVGVGDEMERA